MKKVIHILIAILSLYVTFYVGFNGTYEVPYYTTLDGRNLYQEHLYWWTIPTVISCFASVVYNIVASGLIKL